MLGVCFSGRSQVLPSATTGSFRNFPRSLNLGLQYTFRSMLGGFFLDEGKFFLLQQQEVFAISPEFEFRV
jgi:hypothetical protein